MKKFKTLESHVQNEYKGRGYTVNMIKTVYKILKDIKALYYRDIKCFVTVIV